MIAWLSKPEWSTRLAMCIAYWILPYHTVGTGVTLIHTTDYGHPDRAFFQKFETFGLGQTNWAEILWGIWGISGQTISTFLALWVPCPWESVAGSLSYKKLWFLGLKHITPKYSQNKIWAVQNLENSVRTSVFGASVHRVDKLLTNQIGTLLADEGWLIFG